MKKHYSLYLDTIIIYSHLTIERLRSVLWTLKNELGEDVDDYFTLCIESGKVKCANKVNFDNSKSFDNISSLQNKINEIINQH